MGNWNQQRTTASSIRRAGDGGKRHRTRTGTPLEGHR